MPLLRRETRRNYCEVPRLPWCSPAIPKLRASHATRRTATLVRKSHRAGELVLPAFSVPRTGVRYSPSTGPSRAHSSSEFDTTSVRVGRHSQQTGGHYPASTAAADRSVRERLRSQAPRRSDLMFSTRTCKPRRQTFGSHALRIDFRTLNRSTSNRALARNVESPTSGSTLRLHQCARLAPIR